MVAVADLDRGQAGLLADDGADEEAGVVGVRAAVGVGIGVSVVLKSSTGKVSDVIKSTTGYVMVV